MPDARESLGIELQDSVLVFDEAHNLLDAINSAHNTTITGVTVRKKWGWVRTGRGTGKARRV
jgi:chromosome transmission fidelity protein 1